MINHETFISWAKKHFDDIIVKGDEILLKSIFTDSTKHKLQCNTSKNCYQCWKSGKKGTLYDLVVAVEKCSHKEAISILGSQNVLRTMERKVAEKMAEWYGGNKNTVLESPPNKIKLPPHAVPINSLPLDNHHRLAAERYMEARHLPCDGLYVCICGKYAKRIVIPYRAPDGSLIYWNTRDMTNKSKLRYQGPDDEEVGVGKSQVIWMASWPQPGAKIYLTEGEFDAMSLNKCRFIAGAMGGKNLHNRQIELIKSYKICLSLDADKSGGEALNNIGFDLMRNGMQEVSYVRPPAKYKDWNNMLVSLGEKMLSLYIEDKEQPINQTTLAKLRLK